MDNPNKKWTASDFHSWCEENAAELEAAQAQNQLAVDSVVIKEVMRLLKKGLTLENAGDWLLQNPDFCGWSYSAIVTKSSAQRSPQSIGWLSEAVRKKEFALHEN